MKPLSLFGAALAIAGATAANAQSLDKAAPPNPIDLVHANAFFNVYLDNRDSGWTEGVRWTIENISPQTVRAVEIQVNYTCASGRTVQRSHSFGRTLDPGESAKTIGRELPCGLEDDVTSATVLAISHNQPDVGGRPQAIQCKGGSRGYTVNRVRDDIIEVTSDDGRRYVQRARKDPDGTEVFNVPEMLDFMCDDKAVRPQNLKSMHRVLTDYLKQAVEDNDKKAPDRRYRLQPLGGFGGGRG